jgi:hypothetical protein
MLHKIGSRAGNIGIMINEVIQNNIEGDILDIGVYKGYSTSLVIKKLKELGIRDREVYLYDTFEGMPKPTEEDGDKISKIYRKNWALGTLDEVKKNISKCGYPESNTHYIKGMVEETLLNHPHKKIAYMRLDTDYYSSTKMELVSLYPILSVGGVVIVDDYRSKFIGSTKAVDEFFYENNIPTSIIKRINKSGCGIYFKKPRY